jgi:hypothetical protein
VKQATNLKEGTTFCFVNHFLFCKPFFVNKKGTTFCVVKKRETTFLLFTFYFLLFTFDFLLLIGKKNSILLATFPFPFPREGNREEALLPF